MVFSILSTLKYKVLLIVQKCLLICGYMTPKKSHEHTLKNAISDFLNDQHLDNKLAELNIINNWEKLVGTMIAKNTTEIKFRGTILYLKIESNALRNELMYQRGKIMALVNTEANQQLITDVNIR
jgi:hypothetical protein